jgi:hypothetical protein
MANVLLETTQQRNTLTVHTFGIGCSSVAYFISVKYGQA